MMIIKDILNNKWNCECIGCSIALGEIMPPGGVIEETKNFILHQDPEIPIKAFFIIASKKHIKSISELNCEESQELFDLVYRTRVTMKNVKDIQEVTIIQEERSGHFHLWLLPRYEWMEERFQNSLTSVRKIQKDKDLFRYWKTSYATYDRFKIRLRKGWLL